MSVEPGRFLMVELEPGLHPARVIAFMNHWVGLAGVVSVVDLASISRATLDEFLLQPEPLPAKGPQKRKRGTAA